MEHFSRSAEQARCCVLTPLLALLPEMLVIVLPYAFLIWSHYRIFLLLL